MNDLIWKFIL